MTAARAGEQWDTFHVPIRSPSARGALSTGVASEEAMAGARATGGLGSCAGRGAESSFGSHHVDIIRGRRRPKGRVGDCRLGGIVHNSVGLMGAKAAGTVQLSPQDLSFPAKRPQLLKHDGVLAGQLSNLSDEVIQARVSGTGVSQAPPTGRCGGRRLELSSGASFGGGGKGPAACRRASSRRGERREGVCQGGNANWSARHADRGACWKYKLRLLLGPAGATPLRMGRQS